MLPVRQLVTVCCAAVSLVLAGARPAPRSSPATSGDKLDALPVVWERALGDDDSRYRPDVLAVSEDALWITGLVRPAGAGRADGRLWVWKLGRDGNKLLDVPVAGSDRLTQLMEVTTRLHGMVVTPEGDVVLVANLSPEQTFLVRVTREGNLAAVRRITLSQPDARVLGLVDASDGTLLLVGQQGDSAYVASMDLEGKLLNERTLHRGTYSAFTGGICRERRACMLVGYTSNGPPAGSAQGAPVTTALSAPDVWIAEVNARGEVLKEAAFPGRNARLAAVGDQALAVVYDRSHGVDQDNWVERLDSDLKPVWAERAYVAAQPASPDGFKIAALADGGVLLFGEQTQHGASIVLVKVDRDGRKAWSYEADPTRRPWHWASSDLRVGGSDVFLLTTVFSMRDPKTLNYKVGLIKLKVD
jgi:hypothetical protein